MWSSCPDVINALLLCPRPSPAIVTMLTDQPEWMGDGSEPPTCPVEVDCSGPDFRNITYTSLELFKLTIGMGDLSVGKGYSDVHDAIQQYHGVSWFQVCFMKLMWITIVTRKCITAKNALKVWLKICFNKAT